MKGVILAGGTGSRMSPLTEVTNKHLLPIFDEPMIYKVIRTLTNSGIDDIVIVLGGESVGDFIKLLGNGSKFGATFTYVYQQEAGGIAEALNLTRRVIEGYKVAVILGDNIFEDTFEEEVENFRKHNFVECHLFLKKVPDPERFGVAEFSDDDNRWIKAIKEKPTNPKSDYAVTGLYFYDDKIFDIIDEIERTKGYSARGELEITDVNNYYVNRGLTTSHIVEGFWSDAGTFNTLLKSSVFVWSQKNSQKKIRD